MCGIAGIHVKDDYIGTLPVDDLCDALLLGIEHRGTHATGVCYVGPGGQGVGLEKRNESANLFILKKRPVPDSIKTVLLHTRWATQGPAEKNENNHPVVFNTCFAVHNGHINNDAKVFDDWNQERPAEVDSIAIPMVADRFGFDHIDEALEELNGAMATAIIDPGNFPDELILAKGSMNPLWILNHKSCIMWASEKQAIELAWGWFIGTPPAKNFSELKYGELWRIKGDKPSFQTFDPWKAKGYTSTPSTVYTAQPGDYYRSPDGVRVFENGTWRDGTEAEIRSADQWYDDRYDSCKYDSADSGYSWPFRDEYDPTDLNSEDVIEGEGYTVEDDLSKFEADAIIEVSIHSRACRATAESLNTTDSFVEWILNHTTEAILNSNPALRPRRELVRAEYKEQYRIAKQLMVAPAQLQLPAPTV